MIAIYHNNRCGKSRNALAILEEKKIDFKVIEYLKNIPTEEEIKDILQKLNIKPHDLIRTKETVYIENYKGRNLSDDQWIKAMHDNPILIERPIVVNGKKAIIARPSEKIIEIL